MKRPLGQVIFWLLVTCVCAVMARSQTTTTPDELRIKTLNTVPATIQLFALSNGQFYLAKLVGFKVELINGEVVISVAPAVPIPPSSVAVFNSFPGVRQADGTWRFTNIAIIPATTLLVYRNGKLLGAADYTSVSGVGSAVVTPKIPWGPEDTVTALGAGMMLVRP